MVVSEGVNQTAQPIWSSSSFGMEIQNCGMEQLPNCFFNPNWENSVDQSDPFESALSSLVSSPVTSNAAGDILPPVGGVGGGLMINELIGRIGNIAGSGEKSHQSYIINSNSHGGTNNSCYNNPLNSPPKRNSPMMVSQIRGNLPIPGNLFPDHPNLTQFTADPGFAERAARLSCFRSGMNGGTGLNGDSVGLSHGSVHRTESSKLSKVSSNQSIKLAGSLLNGQESNKSSTQDPNSDEKFSKVSRSLVPINGEFVDSRENSSVSEQIPVVESSFKGPNEGSSRKRKSISRGKAVETPSVSPSANDAKVTAENDESRAKRSKEDHSTICENEKVKPESNGNDGNSKQGKDNSKPPEPPKDYIHVRARRGQATDSHSLAERVRREKISERMKFLQDLVPGCNKVTGKAVMLDEIINYVQSLQRQVEFLSMKLATVNPRMDFSVDTLLSKGVLQPRGSLSQSIFPVESSSTPGFPFGYQPRQGMPLSNRAETQLPINSLSALLRGNPSMHLPSIDGNGEVAPQASMPWEDDLQSLVQMGFGQNHAQIVHGSMAAGHMKVEL